MGMQGRASGSAEQQGCLGIWLAGTRADGPPAYQEAPLLLGKAVFAQEPSLGAPCALFLPGEQERGGAARLSLVFVLHVRIANL